jgi:hypothetical protein
MEGPLWVKSGHRIRSAACPLYPQKRTSMSAIVMSAKCQKQTKCVAANFVLFDHLVGGVQQATWHVEAQRLGGSEVDH